MSRTRRPAAAAPALGLWLAVALAPAALRAQSAVRPAAAEGAAAVTAVRTAVAPAIDGRLDDAAWAAARPVSGFVQRRPDPGAQATQATEVRVLYDDQAIYVGARLLDTHPDSVVAQLARRDQEVYSDWFHVAIDSYDDRRTAFAFSVNPRGVKRDRLLFDDTREDAGWDAVWEVATRMDSLGWTAEFRIPLSQLRFAADARAGAGGAEMTWGINFSRQIARRDEESFWSPIPPEAAGIVSRFGRLEGLRDLRPPRRLELQPYTVARLTRAPAPVAAGQDGDPFHRPNDLFGSFGADLKYGLTPNLTLTATLNPDFGQVEADPSEVNLTAFETQFEEKRPFFAEGADIFQVAGPQLFYSRRIGRSPQGRVPAGASFSRAPESTTILGAFKLTGKTAAGWSVGLMNALTAAEEGRYLDQARVEHRSPVEPLTHYAVARVARDFQRGRSAVGGILTATNRDLDGAGELDFLRSAAYAGGLDGRHRFGGGDYQLSGSAHGSLVRGSPAAIALVQRAPGRWFHRPDADHLAFDPDRTGLAGYSARASLERIGGGSWRWGVGGHAHSPAFEVNDLGFHTAPDQTRLFARAGYERFRPGPRFRRWSAGLSGYSEQTFGGEPTDRAAQLDLSAQLHNQWGGSAWVMRHVAALAPDALRGGPALVRPARYMGSLNLYSDQRRPLGLRLSNFWVTEDGTEGYTLNTNVTAALRASNRLSLSLRPALNRHVNAWQYVGWRLVDGEPLYLLARLDQTTGSLTTRLDYTFTPELSLQLYAQPFVSAGGYADFRTVRDARAARFHDRFRTFGPAELLAEERPDGGRSFLLDLDADGRPEASFADPSFNFRQMRSNAVLRWEYRPGSTFFVVWSQGRTGRDPAGDLAWGRDVRQLLAAPGTNVLLLKLSYWLGL
jgi:hypothetical protein